MNGSNLTYDGSRSVSSADDDYTVVVGDDFVVNVVPIYSSNGSCFSHPPDSLSVRILYGSDKDDSRY